MPFNRFLKRCAILTVVAFSFNCRSSVGNGPQGAVRSTVASPQIEDVEIKKGRSYYVDNFRSQRNAPPIPFYRFKPEETGVLSGIVNLIWATTSNAPAPNPLKEVLRPDGSVVFSTSLPSMEPNRYGRIFLIEVEANKEYVMRYSNIDFDDIEFSSFSAKGEIYNGANQLDFKVPPLLSVQESIDSLYKYGISPLPIWNLFALQRVGSPGIHRLSATVQHVKLNDLSPYYSSRNDHPTVPSSDIKTRATIVFDPIIGPVKPTGLDLKNDITPVGQLAFVKKSLTYDLSAGMAVITPVGLRFEGDPVPNNSLFSIEMDVVAIEDSVNARLLTRPLSLSIGTSASESGYSNGSIYRQQIFVHQNPISQTGEAPLDIKIAGELTLYRAVNRSQEAPDQKLLLTLRPPPSLPGTFEAKSVTFSQTKDSAYEFVGLFERVPISQDPYTLEFSAVDGTPEFVNGDFISVTSNAVATDLVLPPDQSKPLTANDPSISANAVSQDPPRDYRVRSSYSPIHLDKAAVLGAMNEIRMKFHAIIPANSPREESNYVDHGTIEACLGNTAAHWSDITIHYYCQLGEARRCYTNCVRSLDMTPGARDTCFSKCKDSGGEWEWIMSNEFEAADSSGSSRTVKQSDVFRYLMFSETFAFDPVDQEEVINKFYQIADPSDMGECIGKRPYRGIDPTNENPCLATKAIPYQPANR